MKILMTADTVGGVWSYAMELASALAPRGVEVVLATMGAPVNADQRRAVLTRPNVTLHESTFALEWMQDPWADVERAGEWLLDLAARERPDVVHLNGYAHGALPFAVPKLVVAHSCVASWWKAVRREPMPAAWERYCEAVCTGLRSAHAVAAPTRAMGEALVEHYGAFGPVEVIHNARSAERFVPGQKEQFVFSAGRLWDEAKNVAALDRIADRLPWPVYVAGDTTAPDGSKADLRAAFSLGKLDERAMGERLGRASIYALPARYEPFGLSVLEAALAGCALVLGDIDSLRELWDDAALFVPPDDEDALAHAIGTLTADRKRRNQLALAARARAGRYTPERMAARYMALYDGIIGPAGETVAEEVACAS